MNQEIKRVERWRRFHTLSTNSFCLTSSKVFLSFVEGLLLGLLGLARLDLNVEFDIEASCASCECVQPQCAISFLAQAQLQGVYQ